MIYLDNAGTTKPYKEVLEVFNKENAEEFYNPSAGYSSAFQLSQRINSARRHIISLLNGNEEKDQLIFTSGATESNNLAIFGSSTNKNKRYLFSMGEHPSVYNCAMDLKNKGYNVDFIPLQRNGQIDYEKLEQLCDEDVVFVSTMFVSNETGAINDLKRIRQIIDRNTKKCVFHVDAVQGFGKLPINVEEWGINLCSLSAHKIGGLKGIGALYISNGTRIKNINFGGGQEFTIRSGTVNASGIFAFEKACEITLRNREENFKNVKSLKEYLISNLPTLNKNNILVVSNDFCSPYVISLLFEGNRGETIMRYLDSCGVIVGTGSACSTSKVGNRVLENMGYNKNQILGAVRISFGFTSTLQDVKTLLEFLKEYFNKINA